MPRAGRQVRGFTIVSRCRLLRAVCEGQEDRGFLYVAASDAKLNSWEIFVALQGDPPASAVRNARRSCTNEEVNRPMKWIDEAVGSYSPGFRGTVTREDWSYAGWAGRICTLRGVSLWPDDQQSERYVDFDVSLFNGHHILTTRGRTLRETKALSREYVERLGE